MQSSPDNLIDVILARKLAFAGVFFVVFLGTYAVLYLLDIYPEPVTTETTEVQSESVPIQEEILQPGTSSDTKALEQTGRISPMAAAITATDVVSTSSEANNAVVAALPIEMYIARLDRTIPILNPNSRSITDLDEALLKGVVRHPDSATFRNEGNIFILGHSSYLPNVFNKNFQAFNGIQELIWGDIITVRSEDTEYLYRVDDVYEARASDLTVPIANTGPKLTLATCDSFGSVDDRFIVEASLVGIERL